MSTPQTSFAILCWLAMAVIVAAAGWEVWQRYHGGILAGVHFWMRMISAALWLIALGTLSFAVTARWPIPGDDATKQLFAVYLLTGVLFLAMAVGASLIDFWMTWRLRKIHQNVEQQVNEWAQTAFNQTDTNDTSPDDEPRDSQ